MKRLLFLFLLFTGSVGYSQVLSPRNMYLPSFKDTLAVVVQPTDNVESALMKLQAQINALNGGTINFTGHSNYMNLNNDQSTFNGLFLAKWFTNTGAAAGYFGFPSSNQNLFIYNAAAPIQIISTGVFLTHIGGVSVTPSLAAGVGAGTSPSVHSINGNDCSGIISITPGTSPTGSNAIVATITFNTVYTTAPRVVITPGNRNAQALALAAQVLVPANGQTNGVTTTTFVIESGATALTASTAYIWTYQVIQ